MKLPKISQTIRERLEAAAGLAIVVAVWMGVPLLFRAWYISEDMKTWTWHLHKSTFVGDGLFCLLFAGNLPNGINALRIFIKAWKEADHE